MKNKKNNKPLIALFNSTLPWGGGERVFANLAKGFIAKGYRVDFLLLSKDIEYKIPPEVNIVLLGTYKSSDTKNQNYFSNKQSINQHWFINIKNLLKKIKILKKIVHIIRQYHEFCKRRIKLFFYFLSKVLRLISYIKKNKPNVVVGAGIGGQISLLAKLFYKHFNCVIRLENRLQDTLNGGGPHAFIFKHFLYKADKVIGVSDGVREDAINLNPKLKHNAHAIYNPMFNEEIIDKSLEPITHNFFNASNKALVILHVGRFEEGQKNHKLLINSFKEALKHTDLRLILLGTGSEEDNIKKLVSDLDIQDNVSFEGFQPNPYSYMRCADLFVLSSNFEGLPCVLIEAMACGTNVVSTDCPSGPREILDNGKYGTLTPVGDYKALAKGIIDRLNNPLPPEVLVERAKFFSVEKSVNEHLKLFGL